MPGRPSTPSAVETGAAAGSSLRKPAPLDSAYSCQPPRPTTMSPAANVASAHDQGWRYHAQEPADRGGGGALDRRRGGAARARRRRRRRRRQIGERISGRELPVMTPGPTSTESKSRSAASCPAVHSRLIVVVRITLLHFLVSAEMNLPKSAGDPPSAVPPRSASRALSFGSPTLTLTSLFSLSMISSGVRFGAPMPNHTLAS